VGRGLEEIHDELSCSFVSPRREEGEVPRIRLGEFKFTPGFPHTFCAVNATRSAFLAPVTQAVITVRLTLTMAAPGHQDAGAWPALKSCACQTSQRALAYGLDGQGGHDCGLRSGRGTFDISILNSRRHLRVQSTNGDTHLGGDDIDNLL